MVHLLDMACRPHFSFHWCSCLERHHLGFASTSCLGCVILNSMIGQNTAYALGMWGIMAKTWPPCVQMSNWKATRGLAQSLVHKVYRGRMDDLRTWWQGLRLSELKGMEQGLRKAHDSVGVQCCFVWPQTCRCGEGHGVQSPEVSSGGTTIQNQY